jgi:hypothetical protein
MVIMAARPLISAGLKSLTIPALAFPTSNLLRSLTRPVVILTRPNLPASYTAGVSARLPLSRQFHNARLALAEYVETAQHGEGDRNEAAEQEDLFKPPAEPIDASRSAFLGEADSDDGHESNRDIHGNPEPALDASQSAFLGESDSNDAFEGEREITGDTHEALDASQAAFLGEGDSNDAFEGEKEVQGDKHEAFDPLISGFHGESGHHDEPDDLVWSNEGMTISEADIRADQGQAKVAAVADKVSKRMNHLQGEVDDLKTIMGDREGVERDKFRL